jgi:hypothetical protein
MPWVWWGEGWRSRPTRERATIVVSIVVAIAIVYAGLKAASSSFTYAFAPSIPGDTILPGIGDPGSASQLAEQTVRVIAPFVPIVACIAAVLFGAARSGTRLRLPAEFWCALLIAAAIIAQPLLISPNFHGFEGNQARLSALGVVPLAVALAYALRAANLQLRDLSWWAIAAGGAALLVASLNDKGVVVGPNSNAQFVAIELIAAAVLAGLLLYAASSAAGERPLSTR